MNRCQFHRGLQDRFECHGRSADHHLVNISPADRTIRPQRLLVALAALACALGPHAAGQELQRVEEVWGDAGPLNTSLRSLDIDMRQPSNFEHVYRVPGSGDLLTRMDGSLAAVFPRSVYASRRRGGVVPVIPPGTVFYIGGVPTDDGGQLWGWEATRAAGAGGRSGLFTPQPVRQSIARSFTAGRSFTTPISRRLSNAAIEHAPASGTAAPTEARAAQPQSIWTDDFYRRDVISKLLRASASGQGGSDFPGRD